MRAEYEPTAEQRALVENASAIGITQAEIANQLKIDEKTLRKHFHPPCSSPLPSCRLVDGTAPTDLTVTGLARALPYSWAAQEQKIGFSM
jgi:hypothetical protein